MVMLTVGFLYSRWTIGKLVIVCIAIPLAEMLLLRLELALWWLLQSRDVSKLPLIKLRIVRALSKSNACLVGGFKYVLFFTPIWEDWLKPTRCCLLIGSCFFNDKRYIYTYIYTPNCRMDNFGWCFNISNKGPMTFTSKPSPRGEGLRKCPSKNWGKELMMWKNSIRSMKSCSRRPWKLIQFMVGWNLSCTLAVSSFCSFFFPTTDWKMNDLINIFLCLIEKEWCLWTNQSNVVCSTYMSRFTFHEQIHGSNLWTQANNLICHGGYPFVEGQIEPGMYTFPVKNKGLFGIWNASLANDLVYIYIDCVDIFVLCKYTHKFNVHRGRLTWNLQITHLERKMVFQTSSVGFHVNLQGSIYIYTFAFQYISMAFCT